TAGPSQSLNSPRGRSLANRRDRFDVLTAGLTPRDKHGGWFHGSGGVDNRAVFFSAPRPPPNSPTPPSPQAPAAPPAPPPTPRSSPSSTCPAPSRSPSLGPTATRSAAGSCGPPDSTRRRSIRSCS